MEFTIGQWIGENEKEDYKIIEKIGKGGFSKVFKVEDKNDSNKKLALKILHSNNTEVNSNEIKIMRQIDNEYLITFYGHFYYQSNLCILMEFSEKGDMRNQINEKIINDSNYDDNDIFDWSNQLIFGMNYLHSVKKIIHSDIKPENILLTIERKIKLTDFNVSKQIDTDTSETPTMSFSKGSRYYKSPEIINSKYDFKTDIWSAGCVIFELIFLEKFQKVIDASDQKVLPSRKPERLVELLKL